MNKDNASSSRDLSPSIPANETLRKIEPQYQSLVQSAIDGFWLANLQGRILEVNEAYCKMSGYSNEELLSMSFSDLDVEEGEADTAGHIQKVVTQGKDCFSSRHRRKNGSIFDVEITVKFDHDSGLFFACLRDITERKQAEDAIDKMGSLAKIGIWEFNPVDAKLTLSKEVRKIFELADANDYVLDEILRFHADESHGILVRAINLSIDEGKPFVRDSEIITESGKRKWIRTQGEFIQRGGSSSKTIFGTMQDISEIRLLDRITQESELTLNQVEQITHLGHWSVNTLDGSLFHSDEIKRIFGYEPSEYALSVEEAINAYHPDDRAEVIRLFNRAIETGEGYEFDLRIIQPDGNIRDVHSIGRTEQNADGKVTRVYGVFQDITESKQSVKELERSRTLLKACLESQKDTILLSIGLDYRYLYFNKSHADSMKQVYGKDIQLGMNILECITFNEDREAAKSNYGRALQGESHSNIREYGDYKKAWFESFFNPIRNDENEVIGATAMARDITERKKMEEERQKTQRLESLGIIAGGIAHDFNNLMGGLFGYIELAKDARDGDRSSDYLSKAIDTIDRARALTGQLLTFSKGGTPIQKIGHLFPFVQETAKFALSGAKVSCHFDVPENLWACSFDKNQIGQVIDNLIINAQQAMPFGGTIELGARNITLSENAHPSLKKGNYVRLTVLDSGIGISKDLLPWIFDPYFTTKAKGHGLGLATCYSIISRHGGCIDVASEPGKGTTFHVYLPASTESVIPVDDNSGPMHTGKGTFLVMDDEEVMRETIRDMLQSLGYEVICKENGKEAVDFFTFNANDAAKIVGMIFDLTVPGGIGGKSALEAIRKLNREVPAFVVSGYAEDPVMKYPLEFGFSASICKPFRKSELSEMLNKCLKPVE